jgi:hypothetical protein
MAQVVSIVLKLDNGKYRTVHMDRARSIYIRSKPPEHAHMEPGLGDTVGPQTDAPEWDPWTATRGGDNGDDGPTCFEIDGIIICV